MAGLSEHECCGIRCFTHGKADSARVMSRGRYAAICESFWERLQRGVRAQSNLNPIDISVDLD